MTYLEALETYAKEEISYSEAKEELEKCFKEKVEECPWDNIKEEAEKWIRAKSLLEEISFNKMFKD